MASPTPLIERVDIQGSRMRVRASSALRPYLDGDFEVSYSDDVDLRAVPEQIRLLPFIWNVAAIVWATDMELTVDTLDERVVRSFDEVRDVLRKFYPSLAWRGAIRAETVVRTPDPAPTQFTEAARFSGGVDSTFTALRHSGKHLLLITIWGTNVRLSDKRGWAAFEAANQRSADDYAGGLAVIRSNIRSVDYLRLRALSPEISSWWVQVQHGMAYSGVTAPLLYRHGITRLHVASGATEGYTGRQAATPELDDPMSLGTAHVHHDGYEVSRQDKIRSIVNHVREHDVPAPHLRVCTNNLRKGSANCGWCEKCVRTTVAVFVEGGNPVEYGFPQFGPQWQDELKQKLARYRWKFRPYQVYAWRVVQSNIQPASENEPSFLTWLRDFDFEEYAASAPIRRISRRRRIALGTRVPALFSVARAVTRLRKRLLPKD